MIKHLSLWRIRSENGKDKAQILASLRERFHPLPEQIPGLLTMELGVNLKNGPDQADCALYAEFEDRAALQRYIDHPAHCALLPYLSEVRAERRIVDYEI